MTTALLFAGQGESIGQDLDAWMDRSDAVRDLVDLATDHLGRPYAELLARGGRALSRTATYQPVATALFLGIAQEVCASRARPDVVAGHSLGEIPALAVSGAITAATAVGLAARRGALMGEAARARPGGMASLPLGPGPELDALLERHASPAPLVIAAYHGPDRVTVSGPEDAIRALQADGATRLDVEGAWHSPAMRDAVTPFRDAVVRARPGPFHRRMLFNHTGRVESDAARVPDLLARQLVSPIRWDTMMAALGEIGVGRVVLAGPARGIRGLVRGALGAEVDVVRVEAPEDLDQLPLDRDGNR